MTLSVWSSMCFGIGMIVAEVPLLLVPALEGVLAGSSSETRLTSWQLSVAVVCGVALLSMAAPVALVRENKWSRTYAEPAKLDVLASLRFCLGNRYFRVLAGMFLFSQAAVAVQSSF